MEVDRAAGRGAIEFLRDGGRTSELSPDQTAQRVVALLAEKRCFERLLKVADTEPPRVRAMLGAIGEQLGKKPIALQRLQDSLNPFSTFDFGSFEKFVGGQAGGRERNLCSLRQVASKKRCWSSEPLWMAGPP